AAGPEQDLASVPGLVVPAFGLDRSAVTDAGGIVVVDAVAPCGLFPEGGIQGPPDAGGVAQGGGEREAVVVEGTIDRVETAVGCGPCVLRAVLRVVVEAIARVEPSFV